MSNAKKQRKTIECERLEMSSRKLEIPKGTIKNRKGKDLTKQKRLRRGGKNTQKSCMEKFSITWITTVVWSLTESQTSWSVRSSGP